MIRDILRALDLAVGVAGAAFTHKERAAKREREAADRLLRAQAWTDYIAAGGDDLVEYKAPRADANSKNARADLSFDFRYGSSSPQFFVGDAESGFKVNPVAVAQHNKALKERMRTERRALREAAKASELEAIRKAQEAEARRARQELIDSNTECDSPVETLFLRAVIDSFAMNYSDGAFRGNGIYVRKQVEIHRYRVDFLFNNILVVEIDGHEFHSGRDNANRDAKRDMQLRSMGYKLLRIPAYRVHHNPSAAVSDVMDFLNMQPNT